MAAQCRTDLVRHRCAAIGARDGHRRLASGARLLASHRVICLVWYRWATVKYSVFRSQAGNVLVIQDREHDRIVDEINRRRKDQLLALYGELDMRNTLEDEIAKFSWLHEQDVLSKDELEGRLAQARAPFRRQGRQHPASFIDGCAGETGAMRCCRHRARVAGPAGVGVLRVRRNFALPRAPVQRGQVERERMALHGFYMRKRSA